MASGQVYQKLQASYNQRFPGITIVTQLTGTTIISQLIYWHINVYKWSWFIDTTTMITTNQQCRK